MKKFLLVLILLVVFALIETAIELGLGIKFPNQVSEWIYDGYNMAKGAIIVLIVTKT